MSQPNFEEPPNLTPEEKAKARRAITILSVVMFGMIALPFIIMVAIKD